MSTAEPLRFSNEEQISRLEQVLREDRLLVGNHQPLVCTAKWLAGNHQLIVHTAKQLVGTDQPFAVAAQSVVGDDE